MFHRENEVLRGGTGIAVEGATIEVYVTGTDTAGDYTNATRATIYTENVVGVPIANATLVSDAKGHYEYYAPNGVYDEVLTYGSEVDVDAYIQMFDMLSFENDAAASAEAAAASAVAAAASATAAATSATDAAASATAADTSADDAATSATAAGTARDGAVTAQLAAETAQNDASDSASNAAVSETNAATSATDAAASAAAAANVKPTEYLEIALSDEITALTTGDGKASWFFGYDFTITEIYIGLGAAQSSSGVVTVDVNKNGATILSTKATIGATQNNSLSGSGSVSPVISAATSTKGDKFTADLDAAGTGAKGLKLIIVGHRT